jgi:signal transduction histidine kinase
MFGGVARNIPDPLLRFARAIAELISPARTFPETAQADSADAGGMVGAGARWRVSNRTIAMVLGLSFAIVALSLLDSSRPVIHMLHQHRVSTIVGVTVIELALIAAIFFRDGDRQKAERLLQENEARMALAADAANVGLWRWNAATGRFWMTDHCRKLFGVDAGCDTAVILAAVHPDDLDRVREAVHDARRNGAGFDVRFRLAGGSDPVRWLRSRGRAENGADGTLLHVAGSVVDISEFMTMQAEIDRQRQSLIHLTRVGTVGELSGALAHELNQPLTAILSNAQAIQRMIGQEPINLEELRNAISDIVDDDSRAGDIIRHLRTLLKRAPVRRDPVDMRLLADRTVHFVRHELVARRIAPVVTASDEPMMVMGDGVQLQQLLLNLILNAAEAISEAKQKNGILLINGEVIGGGADRRYHLVVSDTGKGIGPEVMERLFEPFFSTKEHGLGLGLSISRAIVDGHGGKIYADCNEWGGASFHVFLPAAARGRT